MNLKITKKHEYYFGFLIVCLVISFFLTSGCYVDDSYESDPVYGGGSTLCSDEISWLQVVTRAGGLYIFGFIAYYIIQKAQEEEVKEKEMNKTK